MPHKRLTVKLQNYGFSGKVLTWFTEFLSGRIQRVIINGTALRTESALSGIPQGSVLGPILFVIVINDLPEPVLCGIKLFTDDAKIYRVIHPHADCEKLQKDLLDMELWARKWQMKFHLSKCKSMRIGNNHPEF